MCINIFYIKSAFCLSNYHFLTQDVQYAQVSVKSGDYSSNWEDNCFICSYGYCCCFD